MEYDFSNLCDDQLEKLLKKLESLQKANIKDYKLALTVINDLETNEKLSEILVESLDLFSDVNKQICSLYANTLNKIQLVLKEHL